MDLTGEILLDRYEVESLLGQGGMGSVYLARDTKLGRTVVIKVPLAEVLDSAQFLARFSFEVQSLVQLEHPHIVSVHDGGEHEGAPIAVVQFLPGGDLSERLKETEGSQAPEVVLKWLRPAAEALDFMHQRGYVHRDIKPANLLFDEAGNVFVSDFGIASALSVGGDPDATVITERLTAVGTFIGSVMYAPPEAIGDEPLPSYDQYSLAVVAYEALSGRPPYPDDLRTALEIHRVKADGRTIPINEVSDLPSAVSDVLSRALAQEPADRFESCAAFAEALATSFEPKRRIRLWVAAGLSITAATGAAIFLSYPHLSSPVPTPALMFQAGSTPPELDLAMRLCQESAPPCDPGWYDSERVRSVIAPTIGVDAREVTNAEFGAFVAESGHVTVAEQEGKSFEGPLLIRGLDWRNSSGTKRSASPNPAFPVIHVTLSDAAAYCDWANKRLPTEDEWEFAARGMERRIFPWGDEWDPRFAIWRSGPESRLEGAGSRPRGATAEGLDDMAGSVWEWTSTRMLGGQVLKGGSWRENNVANLRSAAQLLQPEDYRGSDVGFRCVWDLE